MASIFSGVIGGEKFLNFGSIGRNAIVSDDSADDLDDFTFPKVVFLALDPNMSLDRVNGIPPFHFGGDPLILPRSRWKIYLQGRHSTRGQS